MPEMNPRTKRELTSIICAVIALLSLLSFFGLAGPTGNFLDAALSAALGLNKFFFPVILLAGAALAMFPERYKLYPSSVLGIFLFFVSWSGFLNVVNFPRGEEMLVIENVSMAGGYLGLLLGYPLLNLMGLLGSSITLAALVIISLLLAFNASLRDIAARFSETRRRLRNLTMFNSASNDDGRKYYGDEEDGKPGFGTKGIFEDDNITTDAESDARELSRALKKKRVRKSQGIPLDLLDHRIAKPTSGDINSRQAVIRRTLENFGIPVEMGEVSVGPTVTQFTLKPSDGIKLSRIMSLSNDLALSLAAHPIRIEAPIPGKSLVGIEVPNQTVAIVGLREVLESKPFRERKSNLHICLGKDVAGHAWVADLANMPHLLVAGATGSGKTVCLNSIIVSLLFQNSPDDLKLMLIDPKRVELPVYNGIPHLLTPTITEIPKIINALKWSLEEMDRRYEALSSAKARDIETYNESAREKMPYIAIIIDELADLMVSSASEVETCVIRLAQMARAVGIHLVVATQRPSVDVITGLIKANITSRIAFSVASAVDSRTILDTQGADKLVGRGDMLYISPDLSKPKRIQGCYVSDNDIRKVADFLVAQLDEPVEYEVDVTEKIRGPGKGSGYKDADDELYEEARGTVIRAGKASASYLQRRLKIGYARAARLLDMLEERGIIGPGAGAKPREILASAADRYGPGAMPAPSEADRRGWQEDDEEKHDY